METTALSAIRFGLDASLKVTLLFAVVLLLVAGMRRLSASARHFVAMLGLAGAIALPLATPFVPRVPIPLVPGLLPAPSELPAAAAKRTEVPAAFRDSSEPATKVTRRQSVSPADRRDEPATAAMEPAAGVTARTSISEKAPLAAARTSAPFAWAPWALAVWMIGAAFCGGRLLLGWLRVAAIARGGKPLCDPEWRSAARELSNALSIDRHVRMVSSSRVPVAMTAGVRHPVLLLHESARKWPADRRRVVLLHELAHVRRADWSTLVLAEIAVAIYWFHPLAWLTRREARASAERACDDMVLGNGTKPSVYAAHLLGIVRTLAPGSRAGLPVMAMARPSQFEGRMRAILDPGLQRRGPSRGQFRAAALGLFSVVFALSALQPWDSRAADGAALSPHTALVASGALPFVPAGDEEFSVAAAPKRAPCPKTAKRLEAAAPNPAPAPSRAEEVSPSPGFIKALAGEKDAPRAAAAPPGFVLAGNGRNRDGNDYYSRGMSLHRDERYDEAIAAFQKAIELGYREDAASYNIACGYALKGDKDHAFEWLHKAEEAGFALSRYLGSDDDLESLHSDPRFAALRREAREHRSSEERGEARHATAAYERLIARPKASGDAYYASGRELLKADEYALSAKAFRQAAEQGYRSGTSWYNAACALSLGGDKAAALDSLQKALENGFDDPGMFRKDDDLDAVRGEARFRELQALADELKMPSVNWSSKFLRSTGRREWREASDRARQVADKHPRMGRVWFTLGYVEIQADRPGPAAEAFQKALDLGYRKPTTLYNLACSFAKLDQKDRAFDFLFQALDAGFDGNGTLRGDDDLDNLRGDPRFRKAQKMADARKESSED